MERNELVLTCDICHKKVSDEGASWYGGHPMSGWYKLTVRGGSTSLDVLMQKKTWDICSKECLAKLCKDNFVIHHDNPPSFEKI